MGQSTSDMLELSYPDRKRIHTLKYFTWVEQQGKALEDLNRQWYEYPDSWDHIHRQVQDIDSLIDAFNKASGVLKDL